MSASSFKKRGKMKFIFFDCSLCGRKIKLKEQIGIDIFESENFLFPDPENEIDLFFLSTKTEKINIDEINKCASIAFCDYLHRYIDKFDETSKYCIRNATKIYKKVESVQPGHKDPNIHDDTAPGK